MDAEILTTITGMAGATKATIEAVRAVLTKTKGNREAEQAVREALSLADGLQARLLQLQDIAFKLQEENAQLRTQIRQKEEGAADRERYETRYLGQSPVKVSTEDPNAYLCATCFEDGKKVYLSKAPDSVSDVATHYCPKCQGIVGTP